MKHAHECPARRVLAAQKHGINTVPTRTVAWARPALARDTHNYWHGELVQEMMHKYPQNQSSVGSSGQTITTNVSMNPCNWQICHQTHVLYGCTTFRSESNEVHN